MIDIEWLRGLIKEAHRPGLYTPSDMEAWCNHWYSQVSPKVLSELLDEIERLRGVLAETVPDPEYRRMQDIEIERLRKAKDYATRLLLVLMEKHFPGQQIEPLEDIYGVIDQIDHLTTAWEVRSEP